MRPLSSCTVVLALASLSACAFDPSGGGASDVPPGDGASAPADKLVDDSRDFGPGDPAVLVSDGEETRHGSLVAGSYLDTQALDGAAEVIEGEVKKGGEELEHVWHFDNVPAGEFDLDLVALAYSPVEDSYLVEYTTDYERGQTEILILDSADQLASFQGQLSITADTALDLRVKLPKTPSIDKDPSRRLIVDYLALVQ